MSDLAPIVLKEKLSFNDIFSDDKIRPLQWSHEFNTEWSMERKLNYAQKLAAAMNEAADKMQQDRDRILGILQDEHQKREEMERSAQIAKETLQKVVSSHNEKMQAMQNTIMSLQSELQELRRANI